MELVEFSWNQSISQFVELMVKEIYGFQLLRPECSRVNGTFEALVSAV